MSRLRRNLWWTGLAGLIVSLGTAAIGAWLAVSGTIPALLTHPGITLLLVLVFGGFSLAEIPMMVFALRRLLIERRGNRGVVLALNALYVFFAAVYGLPVLLLTGSVGWGLALCGLSAVRLATSLLFLQEPPA